MLCKKWEALEAKQSDLHLYAEKRETKEQQFPQAKRQRK